MVPPLVPVSGPEKIGKFETHGSSRLSFEIVVLKISKFHWKTTVLETLFNKAANLKAYNFIKIWS